jgi:two-component system, OmpR family, sensor histidine kinase BaeS
MVKNSRRTHFVLLSIVLIALFSGLFLKSMIIRDFQAYVEGERSASVRMVSSDIEESYEKNLKWDRGAVSGIVVSALQLGMQVKLVGAHGDVVMDTEQALALLPSNRASSIRAAAGFNGDNKGMDYRSYPLIIGKDNVGRLDVKYLGKNRSDALTSRTGIVVLISMLLVAALTSVLTMLISQKQSRPVIESLPVSDTATDLHDGAPIAVKKKTTAVSETEKEVVPVGEPALNLVVAVEEEPEPDPDDPLEADDEDMQPLAGDPDRISKIVKGLDGLAKAQALRSAMQKQPLELSPYLNTIIETTRASCPDTQVSFNIECSNDLSMQADPECLKGIMTNLLDNAVKAVKQGGTVTVTALEKGDQIELAVKDTGCGIRRKALPHVFERFYRGSGDGIGLGLTIVKELVDACKGTIEVQSTRGKGSVFIVSIPRS